MKNTIIVNFFAGPGAGKSTAAAWLFYKLKQKGITAELVTEYAKDAVWEENGLAFKCQFYTTGKQAYRVCRVNGKVDVAIVDSPIALGAVYADFPELAETCLKEFEKYGDNNLNIRLLRPDSFEKEGRRHNEQEAIELDKKVLDVLKNYTFYTFKADEKEYKDILNLVLRELSIRGVLPDPNR